MPSAHENQILARCSRIRDQFLVPALSRDSVPLTVTQWSCGREQPTIEQALAADYSPLAPGKQWGAPWSTTWFRLEGQLPQSWGRPPATSVEAIIDLGFTMNRPGFQCEGLAYAGDGRILKGLEPLSAWCPVPATPTGDVVLFVEASAIPEFPFDWSTPARFSRPDADDTDPLYALGSCEIVLRDNAVAELLADLRVVTMLLEGGTLAPSRRARLAQALTDCLDALDPWDLPGTLADARAALGPALDAPASASAPVVHLVGHAHIDSAWLWPLSETRRKCVRTWANVIDLMRRDPDFTFVCSSAQHYAWIAEDAPELFEAVRRRVAEGRFVPVGGSWVEFDANLPSGEAMLRQLILGTRYFQDTFGFESDELWLPDSFGYTATLPQLARAAGKAHVVTQKLSWNDTNAFPYTTFAWEGLDGSRVLTHFPPADTYCSDVTVADVQRSEHQHKNAQRGGVALLPFGWGDGGGGPNREMLDNRTRMADLEGVPRIQDSTPRTFFSAAAAENPTPAVWRGDLYLELHRGSFTSQHRTKQGNRRCESLLREAELWCATAHVRRGTAYPAQRLGEIWRQVLLLQFHDILPGTSIGWVHDEAEATHSRLIEELEALIATALGVLVGEGDNTMHANASPFAQGNTEALGIGDDAEHFGRATLHDNGSGWVLDNARVRAVIDRRGLLVSLVGPTGHDLIPADGVGNLLRLHRDLPANWDAWDIAADIESGAIDLLDVTSIEPITGEDRVGVRVTRTFNTSRIVEDVILSNDAHCLELDFTIDWHERNRLLRLVHDFDVHAEFLTTEIQFGHVNHPTHTNTSWQHSRFELAAQRWVHVGEGGIGVAIANESTYGWSVASRPATAHAGRVTSVRASLLRSPHAPDPTADSGRHHLSLAVHPDATIREAIRAGYALAHPVREVTGGSPIEPLVSLRRPGIVIECVKLAEDGSGDVIVRCYESLGRRATSQLIVAFEHSEVRLVDALERPEPGLRASEVVSTSEAGVQLNLRAFELVTLRIVR